MRGRSGMLQQGRSYVTPWNVSMTTTHEFARLGIWTITWVRSLHSWGNASCSVALVGRNQQSREHNGHWKLKRNCFLWLITKYPTLYSTILHKILIEINLFIKLFFTCGFQFFFFYFDYKSSHFHPILSQFHQVQVLQVVFLRFILILNYDTDINLPSFVFHIKLFWLNLAIA